MFRERKTLPVLKTDREVEEEGLGRLSLDVPFTDEPETIPHPIKSRLAASGARHSIGFDVPGAVHTIMTSKLRRSRPLDSKLVVIMGNVRRVNENEQDQSAQFFNPDNKDGSRVRDELAILVLDQLIDWLKSGGRVAIHDATNSTVERR
ncbi:hypothetical protein G6F56_012644 [Rhizopus delemar]|nr:hypothetical protein G6F56_012644 [Rhizopus delemar]